MARALGALGHDVHGIALAPREKPLGTGVDGVSIHAEDRGRLWPWFPLAWSQAVARRIRAAGPFDVVLAPEFRAEAERYGARPDAGPLVTHLLTSQAQLSTVRPDLTLLERHGPRTRLQLAMERRQAERSRGLLVPGHAILDWARELWGLDGVPVETVPLSIDFDFVRAAAAEGPLPDGWPHGAPTVTLASRLDGHKGAQQLVAAMHRVWRSRPQGQLVFVGRHARYKRPMMSDVLPELAGDRAG